MRRARWDCRAGFKKMKDFEGQRYFVTSSSAAFFAGGICTDVPTLTAPPPIPTPSDPPTRPSAPTLTPTLPNPPIGMLNPMVGLIAQLDKNVQLAKASHRNGELCRVVFDFINHTLREFEITVDANDEKIENAKLQKRPMRLRSGVKSILKNINPQSAAAIDNK